MSILVKFLGTFLKNTLKIFVNIFAFFTEIIPGQANTEGTKETT